MSQNQDVLNHSAMFTGNKRLFQDMSKKGKSAIFFKRKEAERAKKERKRRGRTVSKDTGKGRFRTDALFYTKNHLR